MHASVLCVPIFSSGRLLGTSNRKWPAGEAPAPRPCTVSLNCRPYSIDSLTKPTLTRSVHARTNSITKNGIRRYAMRWWVASSSVLEGERLTGSVRLAGKAWVYDMVSSNNM